MSNMAKLEFPALEVNGKNYMPWTIDAEMHLESMGIREAINFINDCSLQDKARAHVFLRKHIDQLLRIEYLNVSDPNTLWTLLKERFDHQREIMIPNARNEWMTLRFQDFKKVNEYNSALFRICSQLRFCGEEVSDEEMLEKTYSTFHASNITLMQQYRMQRFTRYSELNTCLLVAEQNNDLLMKNHESRPTGSVALPEANATRSNENRNNTRGRGRGRGRGYFNRNQSHNQNHNSGSGRGNYSNRGRGQKMNNYHHPQRDHDQKQGKDKVIKHDAGTSQKSENTCYRCGSTGHWSRTCRTSIKGKGNEANLIDNVEFTKLNDDDFCNDMEDVI